MGFPAFSQSFMGGRRQYTTPPVPGIVGFLKSGTRFCTSLASFGGCGDVMMFVSFEILLRSQDSKHKVGLENRKQNQTYCK